MNGRTAKALRREARIYAQEDKNTARRERSTIFKRSVQYVHRDLDPMTGKQRFFTVVEDRVTTRLVGGVRFYSQRLKKAFMAKIVDLRSRRIQGREAGESLLRLLPSKWRIQVLS